MIIVACPWDKSPPCLKSSVALHCPKKEQHLHMLRHCPLFNSQPTPTHWTPTTLTSCSSTKLFLLSLPGPLILDSSNGCFLLSLQFSVPQRCVLDLPKHSQYPPTLPAPPMPPSLYPVLYTHSLV